MADTNKVWLTGIAVTMPVLTNLPGKGLPICTFELLVREDYRSKGRALCRHMAVLIEALGQQAEKVFDRIVEGKRYKVDGYLRVSEDGRTAIRAFAVNADDGDETVAYEEGLRAALAILTKSENLKTATKEIRLLLKSEQEE